MSLDPRLARWLEELVATPGLTGIADIEEARRIHVDDALTAVDLVREGPAVDVGSGCGSPGLPLAAALPDVDFTLLEASARRCAFLERAAARFANVRVVRGRAEEYGRAEGRDRYAVALARALAAPAVAAEWCLPLVRPGGRCILYAGTEAPGLDAAAAALCATVAETRRVEGSEGKRLLVLEKLGPTPELFPRRPGVARRRPLG